MFRSCRLRSPLVLLGLVTFLSAARAGAIDTLATLLTLYSDVAPVRYTPGALDRASHVQERLDVLVRDLHSWGGDASPIRALALAPEDWPNVGTHRPYGLPERTAQGLAVPAWGDDHSVALWRKLIGGELPWSDGVPLRGSPEEAASLSLSDLLMQVEAVRPAADRAVAPGGPAWVRELLAHVLALTGFATHEQERLGEVANVYAAMAAHGAAHPGVESFDPATNLDTWLAYQPVFYGGAQIIVAKDGRKAAKNLLHLAKSKDGRLTTGDLLKRYPDLQSWLHPEAAPAKR